MSSLDGIIKYTPAKLTKSDYGWYVSYRVLDPESQKLKLQRSRAELGRIRDLKEREKHAKRVISELNRKLAIGWNPLVKKQGRNATATISKACENFLKVKSKELKSESMRSYKSFYVQLLDYLKKTKRDNDNILEIKRETIEDWLSAEYDTGKISSNTFNNKVKFFYTFGAWLAEHSYCRANPFSGISQKKKTPKKRELFSEAELETLFSYLKKENKRLYLFLMMVYHGLLRPQEITRLRVSHINPHNHTVLLTADITKNGKPRVCTFSHEVMRLILEQIEGKSPVNYFMGKNYECGLQPMNPRDPAKEFSELRTTLKLPKTRQIYSLRDNGVIFYLNQGVPPQEIIKQAGHKDLSILSIYAVHVSNAENKFILEAFQKDDK